MKRLVHIGVAVALCCSFLAACAHPTRHALGDPALESTRLERLTVLTYNILHGLEVRGWSVGLESDEDQRIRFDLQARQLAQAQPDVMLLQEVNPLPEKVQAFVAALKAVGLEYTEVHQADACGIRLFGLRLIPGLNNGMAVLAKAPLRIRKLKGLKLSGGIGGCGEYFGLQFGELRYALIAEIDNPITGNKFLAVSLHLHAGIARTDYFIQRVTEAQQQGRIGREAMQGFVSALEQNQSRRLGEIRVLVAELQRLLAEERDLGVILGGDFNFEPGSREYRELMAAGLRDTHMIASPGIDLYSYDPQQNAVVRQKELTIPPSLRQALENLPEPEQQRIIEDFRSGMGQARRIDYLFHMGQLPKPKACLRQALFGEPTALSAQPGSDHYGVLNTYVLDPSQC
ncbi:MAG: endonuclease/exonuclease/phosphatase family protein [Nitrospiraceae bacterium]